jgi:diacylglycerol O-acyltransferase
MEEPRPPDELRFEPRMSDTEALVWSLEDHDPSLRSTIAVVAFLERSPGIDAVRARLERLTRLVPRFRDRVAAAPAARPAPIWEPDPFFDLAFHVRSVQLPDSADRAPVLRWSEPVVSEGLDRSRPLWQMTLVEGWPGEPAALVIKLHHTFTDGLGAMRLMSLLFDLHPDVEEPSELAAVAPVETRGELGRLADDVAGELRRSLSLARRAGPAIADGILAALGQPEARAAAATGLIRSVAHLTAPTVRPLSPILTARSLRTRFEMIDAPLDGARAVARAGGGTVNDVFLTALLGGLRHYHERHGSRPEALRIGVPISTRQPGTENRMRNQFAPVRVTIPLQEPDPVARLQDVHRRITAERAEPGLVATEDMASVVNRVPALRPLLAATMGSVDVVASNVPGVDAPLYLRGARVTRLVPFGPRNGAALNVTVVSYDGTLHLGCNLDAVAIPDHDVLLDSLRAGLAETFGA